MDSDVVDPFSADVFEIGGRVVFCGSGGVLKEEGLSMYLG